MKEREEVFEILNDPNKTEFEKKNNKFNILLTTLDQFDNNITKKTCSAIIKKLETARQQVLDEQKKRFCKNNNCHLIEVLPDYNIIDVLYHKNLMIPTGKPLMQNLM
jgi:GTPase involved in cell partitioning and DNA repair